MTKIYNVGDTSFSKRLKLTRVDRDLTLKQLSSKVGMSEGNLSKYETGVITNIREDNLMEIASALDVSMHYLLGEQETKQMSEEEKDLSDLLYSGFGATGHDDPPPTVLDISSEVLGSLLASVVMDETVRQILLELGKLTSEQRDLALKMIKAIRE